MSEYRAQAKTKDELREQFNLLFNKGVEYTNELNKRFPNNVCEPDLRYLKKQIELWEILQHNEV